MHKIGLSIIGIGDCKGFSKEYFENCYLNHSEFKGFIPEDELNEIIRIGAGIAVRFLNNNQISFEPNGYINCEFNGLTLLPEDLSCFTMKFREEATLHIGEFEFQMKMIAKKD